MALRFDGVYESDSYPGTSRKRLRTYVRFFEDGTATALTAGSRVRVAPGNFPATEGSTGPVECTGEALSFYLGTPPAPGVRYRGTGDEQHLDLDVHSDITGHQSHHHFTFVPWV